MTTCTPCRRDRVRALAITLAMGLGIAGCGIPVSDGVEVIPPDDHLALLEGTTTTTIPEPDPTDDDVPLVGLYFIGPDDTLERVTRAFPIGTTRDQVLEALSDGPTADEIQESGLETLQTQIPVGLNPRFGVQDEDRQSQTVVVDPEGQLRNIVTEQPVLGRLIVTQIVCTALALDLGDITGVVITDGAEEEIVLSDINAEPLLRPATRADFDDCKTGAQERAEAEDAEAESDASTTTTAAGTPTTVSADA